MNDLEVLQAMQEVIERDGWTQNVIMDPDGAVCLLGAYLKATNQDSTEDVPVALLQMCAEWLDAAYPMPAPGHLDNDPDPIVTAFNDDEDVTVEDVMLALKRAIESERER